MIIDDDSNLYFVDGRNADPRAPHTVVRPGAIVPSRTVAAVPVATGTRVAYSQPPAMAYPPSYASAAYWGAPAPVYAPGAGYGQPWPSAIGGLLGGLNLGDVIKLAADAFAVFKSLPPAPAPTGDVATDVANMDVHMAALAKDAQTRKQIEYGGEIAGVLAGSLSGRFARGYPGVW